MNISKKVITIISSVTGIPAEDISPEQALSKDLSISEAEQIDIANELILQLSLPSDANFKDARTVQDLIMAVENSTLIT